MMDFDSVRQAYRFVKLPAAMWPMTFSAGDCPNLQEFGMMLRGARCYAGVRQQDFAEKAGITQAVLSGIERGQAGPSSGHYAEVARAFDLPLPLGY